MDINMHISVCHSKVKKVDYLKCRLQRMVRALLQEESRRKDFCYLNSDHHVVTNALLLIVLIMCFGFFVYQTYERTTFYLTYPVTTDVVITKKQFQTVPEITICYQETERLFESYRRLRNDWCATLPSAVFLRSKIPNPVQDIWKIINSTTAITSAKEISTTTEDLAFSSIPLLFGTCTTFRSASKRAMITDGGRFEIIFKLFSDHKCRKQSMSMVFVHEAGEYPQTRKLHTHGAGLLTTVGLSVRKVSFQNRTRNICISTDQYNKCRENCFIRYTLRRGTCRFPFHPESVNLKPCQYSFSTYSEWRKTEDFLTGYLDNKTCNCARKCQHRTFDVTDTSSESFENMTKVVLVFDNPHETEISERYIYDLIKLLSDIGGLSGLYIGISLLFLFEIILKNFNVKKKLHTFSLLDPLYFKVVRTYKMYYKSETFMLSWKSFRQVLTNRAVIFKTTVLGICVAFFIFGVVNRTLYFFQYPTRSMVDISFNATFEAPSLTICSEDFRIFMLKAKYAFKQNLSNVCQVKIWQLMDLPGINATYLWINPKLIPIKKFWVPAKPVYLQDGTCADLDDGKLSTAVEKNVWVKVPLTPFCGTNYLKVYIRPFTRYYDYFGYRYLIRPQLHQIMYIIKETRIDNRYEPCISEREHAACRNECLTQKLWERVNCRLPYMPEASLPMCNSSSSAKHSYLTYWELFSLQSSSEDCNCLPPCQKRFYETRVSAAKHTYLSFSFGASHNVIESYTRVPSYSLIAFLSDIGGWLGSTLGLCVLTTLQKIITSSSKVFSGNNHDTKHMLWK